MNTEELLDYDDLGEALRDATRKHDRGAADALFATVAQGSPTDSLFASKMQLNANSASEDGGALYNKGGELTINNAVITVNHTPTQTILAGYGGAIYNEGVLTLTNSIVSQNQGRFGGGVFVGNSIAGARAVIDHVSFRLNTSGSLGGAVYTNIETTTVTISNSSFSFNNAATGGGLARSASDRPEPTANCTPLGSSTCKAPSRPGAGPCPPGSQ